MQSGRPGQDRGDQAAEQAETLAVGGDYLYREKVIVAHGPGKQTCCLAAVHFLFQAMGY